MKTNENSVVIKLNLILLFTSTALTTRVFWLKSQQKKNKLRLINFLMVKMTWRMIRVFGWPFASTNAGCGHLTVQCVTQNGKMILRTLEVWQPSLKYLNHLCYIKSYGKRITQKMNFANQYCRSVILIGPDITES